MNHHHLLITITITFLCLSPPSSAVDFIINSFNSTTINLYGNATIQSNTLTLTNSTTSQIGRALYPLKIPTKNSSSSSILPFSTSFIFAMAPTRNVLPGHGFVFIFTPRVGINNTNSAQNLGLFSRQVDGSSNNHVFGVEFDVFRNEEFRDISDNHVGIDVNSLTSVNSSEAGYWDDDQDGGFRVLRLNSGENYQVWIDYKDFVINVTMAHVGVKRPTRSLISVPLNLSDVFEDAMYVGFTASTGQLTQSHKILSWSFSNSNFSLSDGLITDGLPSFVLPGESVYKSIGFIVGLTLGVFIVVVTCVVVGFVWIRRKRRLAKEKADMEDWELEYWPHRIPFQEIDVATKSFSEENVIGIGGNGKVYKGVIGGSEIAVKRITHDNNDGVREFLAEVSSLGRLKHKSLVGLRGWCKKEKGSLILVYDYMENGSLDKMLFESKDNRILSFEERIKILKDVANGIFYLHEGWEAKVLHRDIKSSNVLLDKEMNAKLGDFGLARMHHHGEVATTTRVVGTAGYLAPEVIRTGRASTQTDVFSFGILILEVICGKRPITEGNIPLVNWVTELMQKDKLFESIDEKLMAKGTELDREEVEMVLYLGLLCAHPDAKMRPTMRQVVKALEGKNKNGIGEREDMEVHLLERAKSQNLWSKYAELLSADSKSFYSHPTFGEIKAGISSSMSISSSDIVEGR